MVVINPTLAPLPVSTAFVATVVPCITCETLVKSISDSLQIRLTPSSTPIDESCGVDGTFAVYVCPEDSSTNNKSVKGSDIPAKKDRFTIQVISKKRLADAQQYANKLIKSGYDAYIQKAYFKETEEVWYRVRIGSYDNYNSAQAIANVVSKDIKLSVWVDFVRIDN